MHAKSLQSCPTLYNPMDCSPPGSSVHGILQARVLEWVAMPSSSKSSPPRDRTTSPVAPALQTKSLSLSHHRSQFLSHLATNELCGSGSEKYNNFFEFHIYKMKSFVFLWKKCQWNFYKDCIESIDFFGWCEHFNNINSFNEHKMSFLFCLQFLSSLSNSFQCTSLSHPC